MTTTNYDFSIYDGLIATIKHNLPDNQPFLLAIDGLCGSGKTTLAEYLCQRFDASVIHMDNFFLPFERKTKERLKEAGGNIDYERFTEIILPALKKKVPFSYFAYNCQTSSYDRTIDISAKELIIVEGSYSLHEKFGRYYDYAAFLTVSYEEQLSRLQNRCQDDSKFDRFKKEWIPMENLYHAKQNVAARSNIIIHTGAHK